MSTQAKYHKYLIVYCRYKYFIDIKNVGDKIMKLLFCLVLSFLTVACSQSPTASPAPAAVVDGTTTFTVTTPNGPNSYNINGTENPTLTLKRGITYTFNLTASGHPFYIKTIQGPGTTNAYADGVTGNGLATGTITFIVPATAPATLYYNCSPHAPMTGVMNITN